MEFKFYTYKLDGKNDSLFCVDDNQTVYFYSQYSDSNANHDKSSNWISLGSNWTERLSHMTEISEQSAEERFSRNLYQSPVITDDKECYASLLDIDKPQKTKDRKKIRTIFLIGGIAFIVVLGIIFILTSLVGKTENFFPFFCFCVIFGVLSWIAEEITGFEGEGTVIVVIVGVLIYILSKIF